MDMDKLPYTQTFIFRKHLECAFFGRSFETKTNIWNEEILKHLWFAPIIWKTAQSPPFALDFSCRDVNWRLFLCGRISWPETSKLNSQQAKNDTMQVLTWYKVQWVPMKWTSPFRQLAAARVSFFSSACFALMLVILRFFCLLSFQTSKVSDINKTDKGPETHTVSRTSAAGARLCGKAVLSPSGKMPNSLGFEKGIQKAEVGMPCLQHHLAASAWCAARKALPLFHQQLQENPPQKSSLPFLSPDHRNLLGVTSTLGRGSKTKLVLLWAPCYASWQKEEDCKMSAIQKTEKHNDGRDCRYNHTSVFCVHVSMLQGS